MNRVLTSELPSCTMCFATVNNQNVVLVHVSFHRGMTELAKQLRAQRACVHSSSDKACLYCIINCLDTATLHVHTTKTSTGSVAMPWQ